MKRMLAYNAFMELFLKLIILFVFLFLAVYFSPSNLKAAITAAPFLATPKRAIRGALRLAGLKRGETIYDLGSGTGKVLVIAEKEFEAKGVGFEYGFPIFVFSKINLFFSRTRQVQIFRKSFFEANLKDADVIFLALTPKAFVKLEGKLKEETKPGARIVTFSSPLGFWQPKDIVSLPKIKGKIYLYVRE